MSEHLLDAILDTGLKAVGVIGMAKNAGKTTALNHLLAEASRRNMKIAAASIGRDGEEYDSVTLKKKPRVMLPPGSVFVTTDRLARRQVAAGKLDAEVLADLELNTVIGQVYLFRTAGGGEAELAGLNRISGMMKIRQRMLDESDLFLIDGALDRRSSAVPSLTDGIVLSTGAVVGRDIESVVRTTQESITLLTLPEMKSGPNREIAERVLEKGRSVHVSSGATAPLSAEGELLSPAQLKKTGLQKGDLLIFQGALTESLAEALIYRRDIPPITLIVKDSTRVFVTLRSLRLLESRNIRLRVMHHLRVAAVTANPHNPLGADLDKEGLVKALREKLAPLPVWDVESY